MFINTFEAMTTKTKKQKKSKLLGGKSGKLNYLPDEDVAKLISEEKSNSPVGATYKSIIDHRLRESYNSQKK